MLYTRYINYIQKGVQIGASIVTCIIGSLMAAVQGIFGVMSCYFEIDDSGYNEHHSGTALVSFADIS